MNKHNREKQLRPEEKVSVIVPIYNVEPYLKRCVDSICGQTEEDLEIILVDDGSPDRCPQMCDQFAAEDQRIQVIHQGNAGVSAARNKGIELAAGEWIMFVDPDYWLERNAVEILCNQAERCGCDVIAASNYFNELHKNNRQITAHGKEIAQGEYSTEQDVETILRAIFIVRNKVLSLQVPWAKLYKRELFRHSQCRFHEGMKSGEDGIFNLYILRYAKKLFVLDVPVYHYQTGWPGSITSGYSPDQEARCRQYLVEQRKFLELYQLWDEFQIYYYCVAEQNIHLLSVNESRNIHSFSDFFRAASYLKQISEEPLNAEAIAAIPAGFMGGAKKELGLWMLKRGMYRSIMLFRWLGLAIERVLFPKR